MECTGTNAATERVFSHINGIWTDEKSNLSMGMLKSMIFSKLNLEFDCKGFYEHILTKPKILEQIHGSEKYERPTTSTATSTSTHVPAE